LDEEDINHGDFLLKMVGNYQVLVKKTKRSIRYL
jgi:hypothetical protein